VFERLNDLPALEVMADRAYEHLVASGRFGYRCFAQVLAGEFVKRYDSLAASRPTGGEAPADTCRAHVCQVCRTSDFEISFWKSTGLKASHC
jgi:hypothetical protein